MKVRCINNIVRDRKLLNKFVLGSETLALEIGKIYDAVPDPEDESILIIVNEYSTMYKFSNNRNNSLGVDNLSNAWHWENFFERLRNKNLEVLLNIQQKNVF